MGAWGYSVFANDHVMDTMHDLKTTPLPKFIENCLQSNYEEDIRGGAAVFVQNYSLLEAEIMDDLWLEDTKNAYIDRLGEILNSEWVEDWDDVDLVKDNLKIEINSLERL